jgi:hypothetical protein
MHAVLSLFTAAATATACHADNALDSYYVSRDEQAEQEFNCWSSCIAVAASLHTSYAVMGAVGG